MEGSESMAKASFSGESELEQQKHSLRVGFYDHKLIQACVLAKGWWQVWTSALQGHEGR